MPLDVPGCTRATMIVAESIYYLIVLEDFLKARKGPRMVSRALQYALRS